MAKKDRKSTMKLLALKKIIGILNIFLEFWNKHTRKAKFQRLVTFSPQGY